MAARGSLEKLLKICEHPLIGPHVYQVGLYGCRLDQSLVAPYRRDLEACLWERDLQGIRQARYRLQLFEDFLEEEVELDQHVGIFQILVNALKAIRRHGHSVGLTVFTDPDEYSQKILGYPEAFEKVTKDIGATIYTMTPMTPHESIRSSFKTLFAAVAKSGVCMDCLNLVDREFWYETASSQREKDNSLTSHATDVLLNVKVLDLDLTRDLFTGNLENFANNILQRTKNLTTLYVKLNASVRDTFTWAEIEPFGRTIRSCSSDHLFKVGLYHASCQQADLILMLEKHKNTMRYLSLTEIGLVGSWEEVFVWIRDHCSLNHLSTWNLREYDENEHEMAPAEYSRFSGNLHRLAEFLEQRRKEQAELENEG